MLFAAVMISSVKPERWRISSSSSFVLRRLSSSSRSSSDYNTLTFCLFDDRADTGMRILNIINGILALFPEAARSRSKSK